jgi:uncharacterized protein
LFVSRSVYVCKPLHVLALPLDEASAKVRTGLPNDEEQDYDIPVWAGVIPLELTAGEPIAGNRLQPGITLPAYARNYTRSQIR